MNFHTTFKQMDRSLIYEEYARRKLIDRIEKYIPKLPVDAFVTFSRENHLNKVHCSVRATGGFNVEAENKDEFMYSAIDRLAEKLNNQLRKRKDRIYSHKGTKISKYFPTKNEEVTVEPDFSEAINAEDIIKMEQIKGHL